ncbi:ras-specific guanine nucleotide-releasing factor 2 [Cotesia typhae]
MLSPKMQKSVRINDSQVLMLSERAHYDHSLAGYLHKRTADLTKWQLRWFVLYQNLLFYYDNEAFSRPSGVIMLEGCHCDRIIAATTTNTGKESERKFCFAISYRRENQRQYELKASTESDCKMWIDAIRDASFNKLLLQKEELEQKHLHLLQIVESEKTAKWQYTQQCEELTFEIKKLRSELCILKRELQSNSKFTIIPNDNNNNDDDDDEDDDEYYNDEDEEDDNDDGSSGKISTLNVGEKNTSNAKKISSPSTKLPPSPTTTSGVKTKNQRHHRRRHFITVNGMKRGNSGTGTSPNIASIVDMEKIKKVQSFFRGWLCRRRWKQIVEQYIKSPHAESMRKRNSLVFQMVEAEEEYTDQMEVLVSCFLRPFKMAASSKKPLCSHEDVNSIFLNSETILFLHQIFLKGLTSRMENWPTLVLGDLFDMLLPMLSIYQEYVRNHHYSLQVLTECKQSSPSFAALLTRLENKSTCRGRSLETFLTYPMSQIPRYIITLHEVLAHTPHDHVERKSLENARQQLEDLSRQMHDEVSETENLRKNLAIERMIVEGCDILLDVNQVFVRQGTLVQILDKSRGNSGSTGGLLWSKTSAITFGRKKNSNHNGALRQCFLFSNHLILTIRQQSDGDDLGRLTIVPGIGKIPLSDAILIEDPSEQATSSAAAAIDDDEISVCSLSSGSTASAVFSESSSIFYGGSSSTSGSSSSFGNREFKIMLDTKSGGPLIAIHLLAPTMQEKAAWISDISQCMDNIHFNNLLGHSINGGAGSLSSSSSDTSSAVIMPHSIKNDPKLFNDDVDIRFSQTLNSCKLPQIRYATPERLLQRLTDLRFLSIDFLNTFLLTYRVFTDSVTVLEALKRVFYDSEHPPYSLSTPDTCHYYKKIEEETATTADNSTSISLDKISSESTNKDQIASALGVHQPGSSISEDHKQSNNALRRISGASSVSGYESSEISDSRDQVLVRCNNCSCRHEPTLLLPKSASTSTAMLTVNNKVSSTNDCCCEGNFHFKEASSHQTDKNDDSSIKLKSTGGNSGQSLEDNQQQSSTANNLNVKVDSDSDHVLSSYLTIPKATMTGSSTSSETLTDMMVNNTPPSAPSSPSNKSSITLIDSTGCGNAGDSNKLSKDFFTAIDSEETKQNFYPIREQKERVETQKKVSNNDSHSNSPKTTNQRSKFVNTVNTDALTGSHKKYDSDKNESWTVNAMSDDDSSLSSPLNQAHNRRHFEQQQQQQHRASVVSVPPIATYDSRRSCGSISNIVGNYWTGRRSFQEGTGSSRDKNSRQSYASYQSSMHFYHDIPTQGSRKAGVVITSSRQSHRRSSTSTAAAAFAIATSASSNPPDIINTKSSEYSIDTANSKLHRDAASIMSDRNRRKEPISTAATMRVLNVLRHWVSKHAQDFELNSELKHLTIEFLENIVENPNLLPAEHKAANQLMRLLNKGEPEDSKTDLVRLLSPPSPSRTIQTKENIETLSALEIAEQMTYLDHKIFISILSEEFLGQAWMKADKTVRAPHIILMTKRFNEVSQLVVSEIIRRTNLSARVAAIEKWAAVADICRVLHNYNGVLQICAAFTNSSVYRLKKTWEKVSKTTKQTIERLQSIVSSDGRFRNLRDTLHRCDPPCIPYLGLYLTDLSFIEEGTPNFTDEGLLNFAKMRMIAHVIREIRHFQQTPYKIELITKVTNYLLDTTLLLEEDDLYRMSLEIEPRTSRLSNATFISTPSTTSVIHNNQTSTK